MDKNPVLVLGLDLPFVIAASIGLRYAAALSLEMLIVHIGTMLAAAFIRRWLSGWQRYMANMAASTLLMVFARFLLFSVSPMREIFLGVSDTLGIYIYLLAVNGMTLMQAGSMRGNVKPGPVLVSAVMNALGFAITVMGVSLLREYFGAGTLWDVPVPSPIRLSGLLAPFSGFIVMGFLLAGARFFNKKITGFRLRERARKEARFKVVVERGGRRRGEEGAR